MDTIKDAIDSVNDILNFIDNENLEYKFTSYDYDWLEAAKSALEKQIPSKPQKANFDYLVGFPDFNLVCPKCHKAIINTFNNIQYKPSYCQYCGKALKWNK